MSNVVVRGFGGPAHNFAVTGGYGGPPVLFVPPVGLVRPVMKLIALNVDCKLIPLASVMKLIGVDAVMSLSPLKSVMKLISKAIMRIR